MRLPPSRLLHLPEPFIPSLASMLPYVPDGVALYDSALCPYCRILSAWNFNFSLCLQPLIDVIAAGNCALVKPSEVSPACGRLVKELVERYRAPPPPPWTLGFELVR